MNKFVRYNFIPIQHKLSENIKEYNDNGKTVKILLKVAIDNYCYTEGINYYLLSSFFPVYYDIRKLFDKDYPLTLSFNKDNNDYVVFQNRLYLTKLIEVYRKENLVLLQDCYKSIIRELTPNYVNRKTVRGRTPEAKLLARMLDVSSNVIYFFPEKQADDFYGRYKGEL